MNRLSLHAGTARRLFAGAIRLIVSAFSDSQYKNTGVSQAYEHWSRTGAFHASFMFLDVRSVEEHAEVHIEGAVLIPIETLASRLHEIPRNEHICVFCHSGWRSAKASAILAGAGYANIENVLGGIEAWRKAGYPTRSQASNKIG